MILTHYFNQNFAKLTHVNVIIDLIIIKKT